MPYFALAITIFLMSQAPSVRATVTDSDSNGFTVRHTVSIKAARQQVYRAAVQQVDRWWSDDHTVSGDASNMTIDAKALGCFCESLGDGGDVVHMTVTFVNPEVMIRFTGGLGPLGLMGIDGNMTWEFKSVGEITELTLNYAVGGYLAGGLDAIAPAVDSVLVEQMSHLKSFVEAQTVSD